jgi:hypothetical protein
MIVLPVFKIGFVANKHDGHVGVGVLACFLEPAGKVVECFAPVKQNGELSAIWNRRVQNN